MTILVLAVVWLTCSQNSCIMAVLAEGLTKAVIFPSAGAIAETRRSIPAPTVEGHGDGFQAVPRSIWEC